MSYLDRVNLEPEEKLKALKDAFSQDLEKPKTFEILLLDLDEEIDKFFLADSVIKPQDRYIYIREFCKKNNLKLTESEIRNKIWQGRKRAQGAVEGYDPHTPLTVPKEVWAWDGIWMSCDQNLLVSLPKCGKTTLVVDAIAHWHRGESEFLGQKFIGKCPQVIIVGTDMSLARWSPLLCRFGLAEKVGNSDKVQLLDPIVKLFTSDNPIHLDKEGLDKLVELASKNVGALWLFDSYTKLVSPLGLQESSNEISYPMADLNEYLSPYQATQVIIHHSGRAKGASPVLASRGSTALTAAVSQIISLKWFRREEDRNDKRILIETEGRAEDVALLILQEQNGFILDGRAEDEIAKQSIREKILNLTNNQADVLEILTLSSKEGKELTTSEIKEQLGFTTQKAAMRACRALVRLKLAIERVSSNESGKISFFKINPTNVLSV